MSDFLDRLKNESKDLEEKISKLSEFLYTEAFNEIDPIQQTLLVIQQSAMITYGQVLAERIGLLEK